MGTWTCDCSTKEVMNASTEGNVGSCLEADLCGGVEGGVGGRFLSCVGSHRMTSPALKARYSIMGLLTDWCTKYSRDNFC